jgi:ABC-type amino acid transport substrate-binding protein
MKSSRTKHLGAFWGMMTALVMATTASAAGAPGDTLDRIRQDKTVHIAYREDAPPFSYMNDSGKPAGFMVDLCQAVVEKLSQQLNVPLLSIAYVPVTALDRFEAIQQHKADLLCEPTSATLARRKLVDFSVSTFVDGASLMIRPDGPRNLPALAGQKIGVLAGTTTEEALRNSLKNAGLTADIIPVKTHTAGLAMLDEAKISAYFADRSILTILIKNSKMPADLTLADVYLTVEPYALAMSRGDEDFRLEVDRALSRIYRSGEIGPILDRTFGRDVRPGPVLQTMYLISGLPE